MDQETLNTLMTLVVLPLLVGVSGFAVAWLRKKTQEITENIENTTAKKYIGMASEAVTKAVQTTFQTYVDTLKAQGKFDKEAQLAALQKSKDTAAALITDEAKKAISEAYGDFDKWLAATIETLVREDKKTSPAAVEEKQTQIATTAATAAASVAATVAQTAAAQVVAEAETARPLEMATE
ncbi:MAG: hypothetical protein OSJ59_05140 [Lachnospiraceae bacterium]|jgi:hypothetical protein|nr:hypothetical protein [Lachnospiraceae bacterium]